MLEVMRSHKFFSYLLMGIIFVITISFVFWGIGPNTNPAAEIVAEIEDRRITLNAFWRAYDSEYKRAREIYSDEEEIAKLNLKGKVIEALVEREVILIAAEKAGITVTDEELQEVIMKLPYFQRDGVFNRNMYVRVLQQNRTNPQIFEEQYKSDLIFSKMSRLIRETVELSSEELTMVDSLKESNNQIADAFLSSKSNQAMKAYADGMKRRYRVRINWELIS